ncbi:MAG: hypothetical protein E7166_05745 [Firmicutes bacterium]|nr:hypothetical protein [Bacillota bacterium]
MKKNNFKKIILNILMLLISYYAVLGVSNQIFISTNIGPYGLKNNAPYWKFVLGFNHDTKGSYSSDDYYVLNDKESAIKLIKERVYVNPVKHITLFKSKIQTFWNSTTLSWSFHHIFYKNIDVGFFTINLSEILIILEEYNNLMFFGLYMLILVGLVYNLKKQKIDKRLFLIINQIFVTFGVYLLIEVQPRYSYFIQISVIILSALGIDILINIYNKKKKEKER